MQNRLVSYNLSSDVWNVWSDDFVFEMHFPLMRLMKGCYLDYGLHAKNNIFEV